MPHCVIDYAKDVENTDDIKELMNALHAGMNASGLFKPHVIKTRARAYEQYITGEGSEPFVHTTVFLLEGRTDEQKKDLSMRLLKIKQDLLSATVPNISVDVRDMVEATFSK